MNRYKIKITHFESGRAIYQAYFKKRFYWTGLSRDGKEGYALKYDDRNNAIDVIDLHACGNMKISTIIFEHFTYVTDAPRPQTQV